MSGHAETTPAQRSEGQPFEGSPLTDAEVSVIAAALDLFSRVLTGQIEEVEYVLRGYAASEAPFTLGQLDAFGERIRNSKEVLGLPRAGSLGIYNSNVHPDARLAWSLLRRMQDRDDEVHRYCEAEADGRWNTKHGTRGTANG